MARVVFFKNKQKQFLEEIKKKSTLSWDKIGKTINVSGRTLRDWRREKLLANKGKVEKLSKIFSVSLPKIKEIRKEYWSARKYASSAAKTRYKMYGAPGDLNSRKKGGLVSQRRRRENPEYYRKLGCNLRNEFKLPLKSNELAEFVGILLGDGHISDCQVKIYQGIKEKEYICFIKKLIKNLFNYNPKVYFYKNVFIITCNGIELVNFLEKIGLKRGNKIKNGVSMPQWVKKNAEFRKACVRGLFDTDGCLYFHNHKTKGIRYCHFGFCFTSYSKAILEDFEESLKILDYNMYNNKKGRIYIYQFGEIKKYFKEIGFNNPKHTKRLEKYIKENNK